MKPMTVATLRALLEEAESGWTSTDEEYFGKFEDQDILMWIPKQGYTTAKVVHEVALGGFLVVGLDRKGGELL